MRIRRGQTMNTHGLTHTHHTRRLMMVRQQFDWVLQYLLSLWHQPSLTLFLYLDVLSEGLCQGWTVCMFCDTNDWHVSWYCHCWLSIDHGYGDYWCDSLCHYNTKPDGWQWMTTG